jgi:eukaryotic-like serine/threonine-protein kinase
VRLTILDAVKTDPGDELAWLALADSLEESGKPQAAELHRLLVALRRPDTQRLDPAERRLRRLLDRGVRPVMPTETIRLSKDVEMKFVLIPPGTFLMGSPLGELDRRLWEGPVHRVTITKGFFLGIHPVTQAQWEQLLGGANCRFPGEDRPVERVSWADGHVFCEMLTRRAKRRCRLPTEAEWEYACRAGTTAPFHFGETLSTRQANYNACTSYGDGRTGTFRRHTMSVGAFAPNAFGLFDMHGNIGEWCQDAFSANFYRDDDVENPRCYGEPSSARVVRGGSWYVAPALCRSAARDCMSAPSPYVGFRVVMELGSP